jgi:BCD family chlorophyll transporter-like MFS transporter
MGLWGAAQACAFGGGGFAATLLSDALRQVFALQHVVPWQAGAYAGVFAIQAAVFSYAAVLALRLEGDERAPARAPILAAS